MTKKTRGKIKKDLLERRSRLIGMISSIDLSAATSEGAEPGDDADMAIASRHNAERSMLAESETAELLEIEEALQRLSEGIYGTCEDCGSSISEARLRALPFSSMCIGCKRRDEVREAVESSESIRWYLVEEISVDEKKNPTYRGRRVG